MYLVYLHLETWLLLVQPCLYIPNQGHTKKNKIHVQSLFILQLSLQCQKNSIIPLTALIRMSSLGSSAMALARILVRAIIPRWEMPQANSQKENYKNITCELIYFLFLFGFVTISEKNKRRHIQTIVKDSTLPVFDHPFCE